MLLRRFSRPAIIQTTAPGSEVAMFRAFATSHMRNAPAQYCVTKKHTRAVKKKNTKEKKWHKCKHEQLDESEGGVAYDCRVAFHRHL